MSAYRDPRDGRTWRYRCVVTLPTGGKERISGMALVAVNTTAAALAAERAHVERVLNPPKPSAPSLRTWFRGDAEGDAEFNGRFWQEWVVGRQNKPTERRSKRSVYLLHLEPWSR